RQAGEQSTDDQAGEELGGFVEGGGDGAKHRHGVKRLWLATRRRRSRSASRRRDALPESLPPLRLELRRNAREHGLAEALDVRLNRGHAGGLERVDELAFLRQDFRILRLAVRVDGRLEDLSLLRLQRLPRRFVHDDEPRRDDVAGEHQVLLDLEELVALDRRQRVLLAVDRPLAQREIELSDVEGCRT